MRAAEAVLAPPLPAPRGFDGGVAAPTKPATWAVGEILSPAGIELDGHAATKREAFGHLAALLAGRAGASREAVKAALLRRERLGPTYIGDGMAMPHGRLDRSIAPAAAVLRLRRPVDYRTAEDDAVDLLVGVVWPATGPAGFVPTLAGVRRLLRKGSAAHALRQAKTPEELHLVFAAAGDAKR